MCQAFDRGLPPGGRHAVRRSVPIETVCKDYFAHLTLPKPLRKVSLDEIELPLTCAEKSQKSARGVHLQDLAYLDKRRKVALYEARAFKEV